MAAFLNSIQFHNIYSAAEKVWGTFNGEGDVKWRIIQPTDDLFAIIFLFEKFFHMKTEFGTHESKCAHKYNKTDWIVTIFTIIILKKEKKN